MRWTWPKKDGVLGALNEPMKALENALALGEKVTRPQSRIATSDATVTTLEEVVIPVDTTVGVRGAVVARRTGGSAGATNDGAFYTVTFAAKNTAGTAALIGAGTVTAGGESQAGWDVTLSASGGVIRIRVTGAANNAIQWRWSATTLSVKE